MIDLNDFKSINDLYGHTAGDVVLIATARRLRAAVRASDTVARFGGDEFVLIIESIEDPQAMVHMGEKLFDSLAEPITLDIGVLAKISASIGMAIYPDDGANLNDLLNVADQAMYQCKSTGFMSLQQQ
jgi:diguanylate cyclase (GGDEF)-like protein